MNKLHLKKKRRFRWQFLCFPIFVFVLYIFLHYSSFNTQFTDSNEKFIKRLLHNSNSHWLYEKQEENLFSMFMHNMSDYKLNEPITVLESTFAYVDSKEEKVEPVFGYIENSVIDSPRIYIYSTHPTEEYVGKAIDGYGSKANVIMASYLLQDKLNNLGIQTVVEERSAADYIKEHNLSYEESYEATRVFLKDALEKYQDLDLIIDLHRDAGIPKSSTTTTINGNSYAKVMFVMKPTLSNIEKADEISKLTNSLYPNLSRGIYDKRTSYFNQDLHKNALLLELGGNYNTVEEVVNTIDALSKVIKEYLDER